MGSDCCPDLLSYKRIDIGSVVVYRHSVLVHICLVVTLSCKKHCNCFSTFTHVDMTLEFLIKCFFSPRKLLFYYLTQKGNFD